MAGEWIKVEFSTANKPEVMKIARILGIDRDAAFGKLIRFWAWIDVQSVDGVVDGVVDTDVDEICYQKGFAKALEQVGWLVIDEETESISLPNFDRHNGETAKQRALKNKRQSKWRHKNDNDVDASPSTEASTREEKRREEKTSSVSHEKIVFDGTSFQNLNGHIAVWQKAYPTIDVEQEIAKATSWVISNPAKQKKQWGRFLNGWMGRAKGNVQSSGSALDDLIARSL